MISLNFDSGPVAPADYTPDYSIPAGFQAGEQSGLGNFTGDGEGINSGWISDTISGVNVYAEVVWPDSGNNVDSRGPMFVNASGDGYMLLSRSSDYRLFRITGGTSASLTQVGATISQSCVAGDVVRLEYKGAGEFVFYHNGVQVGTRTDTTVTTGLAPGFFSRDVGGSVASFAAESALAPTITNINTTNNVVPGSTATLTGTNLTNTTGINIGGVAQSAVTVVNSTTVTFTVVRGGNPYNQDLTAQLTSSDGTSSIVVQQVPKSGTFAVTAANPNTTDDASLWTGLVDTATSNPITIVDGDQALVKNPNNLTNLAVAPDGTITADTTGTFVVQIWLASEGVWGGDQTVTFTDQEITQVPQGTVTIGTITVGETTASIPFTYNDTDQTGFEYSLDGGAWTATTSPVSLSDLSASTGYSISVRAVNGIGSGTAATDSFTTDAAATAGPAVSTVNVPTAGSYGIGDTLSFTVNWDVAATVTGTPRLPITLATGTVYADYASGTGTTALVFSYTVQEGDNDAGGISLNAIELNGGTIKDASTNNASLTISGVESTAGVLVDGVRPVITIAGDNPYNMTVGETYVEQGATASDNQDGSLGSVTGTGSVDGQTEGQYTITYPGAGVVDAAGNVALDVTRVVNVNAVDAWPFSKRISYAAPKTWTWGNRHPKTGMRVRIYK